MNMQRLSAIQKLMENSTEFKKYNRMQLLLHTWGICCTNRDDLYDILTNAEVTINMELGDDYPIAISEITRRLINHIGTVFLLVEYMRRENEHLKKENRAIPEYSEKVKMTFEQNGNIQFVHKLRNYVIHNAMLNLKLVTKITPNSEFDETRTMLETEELLHKGEWNRISREYIMQNAPQIDLFNCIKEYSDSQEKFFIWFLNEYKKQYETEFSYCENLLSEWNSIVLEIRKGFENIDINDIINENMKNEET